MGHTYWNDRSRLFDSGETIAVLALGDSWFHYPFNNLITPLYTALEQPTIYVVGESGARGRVVPGRVARQFSQDACRISVDPSRLHQCRRQ